MELRKAQALASEARADANLKTKIADAKKKYVLCAIFLASLMRLFSLVN